MCAGSSSLAAEVNSRDFWSSNKMLEVEHRAPSSLVFGATQQALKWMEHTKGLNLSALVSKNADQPWDVELTDDRRRRFKKRNIAEKVNGTCKQVPTVNKDFSCCETTQQKIQVPGVDREMCLKKEFYYCDSTLQKQGLSCSNAKEEDFKKESLLQLRPITRFQLQRCCRDVLTACDRKEIQQLCIDCSHETYIAVTVPHILCSLLVSNVARARLWTEEDCQQRDWIQNTNFTAGRVFSTTRRVRFTTRRAVTTRRLCGNNTTKNCTARRAVTERRLNMQHKTKNKAP
ncbi:hypothetical protein DPMN_057739 [Dreissena polymorpha]|uniref:Uncharacterized protein n=1 Tax=Dreissena polymorpha TaxID=45954 RepID=A0A9D4C0Q2_DREPO|nr:hypothetical protein DPMN_057739 [Dreissena polymorpha]